MMGVLLFLPFRYHGKVVKIFLELFVLPQGKDHRDSVSVFINDVLFSCSTHRYSLLTSRWSAETINLFLLHRVKDALTPYCQNARNLTTASLAAPGPVANRIGGDLRGSCDCRSGWGSGSPGLRSARPPGPPALPPNTPLQDRA